MISFRILAICLLIFTNPCKLRCSDHLISPDQANEIQISLQKLASDSEKIHALNLLAQYYAYQKFDEVLADSLSHLAIELAEKDGDTHLKLESYNDHLERVNQYISIQCPHGFIDKMARTLEFTQDPYLRWRTNINLSKYYSKEYKLDQALAKAYKSLFAAQEEKNESFIARSNLRVGQCLMDKSQHLEAFKNYMKALSMAEELQDNNLLLECYSSLSKFYSLNNIDEKAKLYKQKEFEQLASNHPIDSALLAYAQLEYEEIMFASEPPVDMNIEKLHKLIRFAKRSNNENLKLSVLAVLRSYLIEKHSIEELFDLYNKKYPEELEKLKKDNYLNFLRVRALLFEYQNEPDSSIAYFEKASNVVESYGNKNLRSKFHIRYGQFWERQGKIEKAILEYESALKFATESGYIPFSLDASQRLEELSKEKGDFKRAYEFARDNARLTEEFANIAKQDELLRLEIQNADALSQLALQAERAENEIILNEQKATKRYFIIAWAAFLLLAIGLFSRLRYSRKMNKIIEREKSKSDDLLLNILPAEIAEELKINGKAEAKDFKRVSVLFTDFKNFTGLSELMTAQELVEEVNACFEVFDRITSTYKIEKIKTIGDAYMAAGGIPIQSKESVRNTLLASFEMQEFILDRYQKKKEKGELCLLMRVGIHTGPVVAGIVGVKKFQYDLWGDTVNTASRMESNGKVNEVNISKTTYELLKNDPDFSFEERQEIDVKGKGKMKMYFAYKNTIVKEMNDPRLKGGHPSADSRQTA